jgi:hypothetical protein
MPSFKYLCRDLDDYFCKLRADGMLSPASSCTAQPRLPTQRDLDIQTAYVEIEEFLRPTMPKDFAGSLHITGGLNTSSPDPL